MCPRWGMAMAAAGPEGTGWELLLSLAPLKGCDISLLPLPFAPRPEALISSCKAESSAAAGRYPDTWGAFVCLGEQPSCSPSPASYQLQI